MNTAEEQRCLKKYMACRHCDCLVYAQSEMTNPVCPHCGMGLAYQKHSSVRNVLIFSSAALLLYLPVMTHPIISLAIGEQIQQMSLAHGVAFLFSKEMPIIAMLALVFCVISPLLRIYFAFLASLLIKVRMAKPVAILALRFYFLASRWDMLDIFWIALLVSLFKLGDLADVSIEFGMFYLTFFVAMAFATKLTLDPRSYWRDVEAIDEP